MEKDKVITDLLSRITNLEYEVERLHNIMKEVREYIKYNMEKYIDYELTNEPEEILYILEKENK